MGKPRLSMRSRIKKIGAHCDDGKKKKGGETAGGREGK